MATRGRFALQRIQRLTLAVLGTIAVATPGLADEPPTVAPTSAAPTPAEAPSTATPRGVLEEIDRLDDDRYAVREAVQQKLLARGLEALPEVGRTAAAGSLESATRAVNILLQWAQSEDNALSLGALEHLAVLTNRPAEAAMAANRLADVRERAAMEAIVKLGGRVEFDRQVPIVIGNRRSVQVVIGPKWTGGVEGLKHLEAMRTATTLSFYSSPISGEIAASAIKPLLQLQRIEFYGTPASPGVVEHLHKLMPHVLVDIRGGARLGIAAGPDMPGGAQVGEVQPGTAAEKAGLMRDDVITEFGGVAVADFKSLTAEIAKAKPGDSVKLRVLRPNPMGQPLVPIEITVEFAEWNDEQAVNPGEGNPLGGLPLGMPSRMNINR
jgi:hypothetical protein